jgi:hypothetical protein
MELQFPQPVPPQTRSQNELPGPVSNTNLVGGGGDGVRYPAPGSTQGVAS